MISITLLSKTDCHLCDRAKKIIADVSSEYPIELEAIDLATSTGQRMAVAAGIIFAPGILVEGRAFAYGRLSEKHLRRELARLTSAKGCGITEDGIIALP